MDIKNIIKQRREELGLTYEELGKMVGVGKSTVRKWEIGMIENIKRDNIVALSKALEISPAAIMGWDLANNKKEIISSKDERYLIDIYQKLNDIGKREAIKRVKELSQIPLYVYDETLQVAAHDDNLTAKESEIALQRALEAIAEDK